MKQNRILIIGLLLAAVLLGACAKKPETVSDVSKAFWDAVIQNDSGPAVAYSTLENADGFDRFGRDWHNMIPSWEQIIIDGDEARVNTQVSTPDVTGAGMLYFVTYLVKTPDGWKVDYERTGRGVRASGAVVDFVDRITTMGEDIQRQFEQASENVAIGMGAAVEQLDRMTEEYQDEAGKAIDDTANSMRQLLDEFSRSLEKALEDLQGPGLTQTNRTDMQDAVNRLQSSSRELDHPSLDAIANSGQQIIIVTDKLSRISNEKIRTYAAEWNRILAQFDTELKKLITGLTGQEDGVADQGQQE
jgi:hypothetical protein